MCSPPHHTFHRGNTYRHCIFHRRAQITIRERKKIIPKFDLCIQKYCYWRERRKKGDRIQINELNRPWRMLGALSPLALVYDEKLNMNCCYLIVRLSLHLGSEVFRVFQASIGRWAGWEGIIKGIEHTKFHHSQQRNHNSWMNSRAEYLSIWKKLIIRWNDIDYCEALSSAAAMVGMSINTHTCSSHFSFIARHGSTDNLKV